MPNKPVTLRRWQIGVSFLALAAVFTGGLRHVQNDTASIHDLQRTNCGLYRFLLTAEITRVHSAERETGAQKLQDTQAAAGYKALAEKFRLSIGGGCLKQPLAPVEGTTTTGP